MSEYHVPVLLKESVDALITNPSGTYIDATYGGGGHSAEILSRLSPEGRLIAFDRDSDAIAGRADDPRLTLIHNNFRFVHNFALLEAHKAARDFRECGVDGILADLGVSSHQFDTAERGFSFRYDAPLDMRMNTKAELTAADVVNSYPQDDLEQIFRLYGEIDNSRRLAALIAAARDKAEIRTTGELDAAIAQAMPPFAEHKYLAKVYQALRIEVNQEMRSLGKFLDGAAKSLKPGGRLVVITYHSLEDRMVKNYIKSGNIGGTVEKDVFGRSETPLRALDRKPVLPQEAEIAANTRARSAKLRTAEKPFPTEGGKRR
jgi:16S rRNA (cytosine1402-N4)-methyltransferase